MAIGRMVTMNQSLRILTQKIPKLPTMPAVAGKIINLISSDTVFVNSIVDMIEKDPAISAKVIGFSNAAFYSRGRSVTTIRDAVMKIGFDNVKGIALGISLLTIFRGRPTDDAGDYERIIRHSIAVGVIAKDIADVLKWSQHEEVFTCGMLHDIGLLVMNAFFPDMYVQITAGSNRGIPLCDAEMGVCGFTHGEIGAWLADKWNLPDSVCEVIQYHHSPFHDGPGLSLAAVVYLADMMAIRKDICPKLLRGYEASFDNDVLNVLGMTQQVLTQVESRVDEVVNSVMQMWS
jgi:putative nucleotidyltransferase with HDIG domain